MKDPHILLASGNCRRMIKNVSHLLNPGAVAALNAEVARNTVQLFELAEEHFNFAVTHCQQHWRQRISRLYYAAYTATRAVRLFNDGHYSTDPGEHQKLDKLPDGFTNKARYAVDLPTLRGDRNLADYDHSAIETDLGIAIIDAEALVTDFLNDARAFLRAAGLPI